MVFKFVNYNEINNHAIQLVNGQQLSYGPIYNLRLIEFEILKAYIETNLANGFIKPSKSSASIPIFFNQNSNRFFWLCINYSNLNNFMI